MLFNVFYNQGVLKQRATQQSLVPLMCRYGLGLCVTNCFALPSGAPCPAMAQALKMLVYNVDLNDAEAMRHTRRTLLQLCVDYTCKVLLGRQSDPNYNYCSPADHEALMLPWLHADRIMLSTAFRTPVSMELHASDRGHNAYCQFLLNRTAQLMTAHLGSDTVQYLEDALRRIQSDSVMRITMYPGLGSDPDYPKPATEILTDTRMERGPHVTVTEVGCIHPMFDLQICINQYVNTNTGGVIGLQILCGGDRNRPKSYPRIDMLAPRDFRIEKPQEEFLWGRLLCLSYDQALNTIVERRALAHNVYKREDDRSEVLSGIYNALGAS